MVGGRWLLVDTAAPRGVVGVAEDGVIAAERFLPETRRHAEELPFAIEAVLDETGILKSMLDGIAVGVGPGSFIGVRVGLATAKGLGLGLGVRVRGVSTLLALAASSELVAGEGLAVLDARRGELYAAVVSWPAAAHSEAKPVVVGEARAVPPELLADVHRRPAFIAGHLGPHRAAALRGLGSGTSSGVGYPPTITSLEGPTALGLFRALSDGPDQAATLVPDYCRPPDAKLPAGPDAAR